jgi:hypothetical protein
MEYEKIKNVSAEKSRRLTGVKPQVFEQMVKVLCDDEQARRLRGGCKKRLFSVDDRLLMMLEYYREYRTSLRHAGKPEGVAPCE